MQLGWLRAWPEVAKSVQGRAPQGTGAGAFGIEVAAPGAEQRASQAEMAQEMMRVQTKTKTKMKMKMKSWADL